MDRYASLKKVWGDYYQSGGLILTDRYTTSNAVHQAVKCPPQERGDFLRWLDDFEHTKLGLPRPDLVLYLDMPTDRAVTLLRRRESDTHTHADIHEVDSSYLAACRDSALQAAQLLGLEGHLLRGPQRTGCAPSRTSMRRSGLWRLRCCNSRSLDLMR